MTVKASDLMSRRDLIVVSPDCSLFDLARVLQEHEVYGAAVVDSRGRWVGVVSHTQVLRVANEAVDPRVGFYTALGKPRPIPPETLQSIEAFRIMTAGDVVQDEFHAVDPTENPKTVTQYLRLHGIHRVVVASEETLLGILSIYELRQIPGNPGLAPMRLLEHQPPE